MPIYLLLLVISFIFTFISYGWFLISLILFAIFILIVIWTAPFTKQNNKLKHKIIYPLVKFVHTILKIKIEVIGRENIPMILLLFIVIINQCLM